jgi:hypothetical protein
MPPSGTGQMQKHALLLLLQPPSLVATAMKKTLVPNASALKVHQEVHTDRRPPRGSRNPQAGTRTRTR